MPEPTQNQSYNKHHTTNNQIRKQPGIESSIRASHDHTVDISCNESKEYNFGKRVIVEMLCLPEQN